MRVTSDRREKKPLPCGTAQDISHLRLRYPLGTWNTRVFRRFGRIRELPLLSASRLQGQDPPSLGWTYYDSLGPASDEPAHGYISNLPMGTQLLITGSGLSVTLDIRWSSALWTMMNHVPGIHNKFANLIGLMTTNFQIFGRKM